jgi:hypothetical protein
MRFISEVAMLEQQLFNEILKLPPLVRASFAEKILASLEQPDDLLLAQWEKEAESRIEAYEAGLIKTTPAETEYDEAYHYYESQQQGLGEQFTTETEKTLDRIKLHPHAWKTYTSLSNETFSLCCYLSSSR